MARRSPTISLEYHMSRLATGMDITDRDIEKMAERVFNPERAVQIRNRGRSRRIDEEVIPYFEREENRTKLFVGSRVGMDRDAFVALLDQYYELRGWEAETG